MNLENGVFPGLGPTAHPVTAAESVPFYVKVCNPHGNELLIGYSPFCLELSLMAVLQSLKPQQEVCQILVQLILTENCPFFRMEEGGGALEGEKFAYLLKLFEI